MIIAIWNRFFGAPPENKKRGRKPADQGKILEAAKRDLFMDEIAKEAGVSYATARSCLARNGIKVKHRKRGASAGQNAKLSKEDIAGILFLDNNNIKHPRIAKEFGVTRERIRQVCLAAGHKTRRIWQRENIEKRHAQTTIERIVARKEREAKRLTATPAVRKLAELCASGATNKEIAEQTGRGLIATGVEICRYRKRWPHLFPYRRAWRGKPKGTIVERDTRPYWKIRKAGK